MPTREELVQEVKRKRLVEQVKALRQKPVEPTPTTAESAIQGGLQGASFGFADEIEGGLLGVKDVMGEKHRLQDILDRYKANRDTARDRYAKAEQANPLAYTGGEIAGGVATGFIPGFGWMNAAKGAKLGATLGKGAVQGAVAGLGTSEGKTVEEDLENTVTGAGLGAAGAGVIKGVTGTVKSITPTNAGKKLSSIFLNAPEEITETYIQNPKGVRAAPLRHELAREYEGALEGLKKDVTQGSKESRDILAREGIQVPGSEIGKTYGGLADEIKNRMEGASDERREAAYRWLKSREQAFAPEPARQSSLLGPNGQPIMTPGEDRMFSANRLKDEVQSAGERAQWEVSPGRFSDVDDQARMEARARLDKYLKSKSPAYTEQMKGVASDADLLSRATEVGKSPAGLSNMFRRLETDKYGGGQAPREVIGELDKRLGTDFLEKAKLSNARETFDKSAAQGSRNVQMFSKFLEDFLPFGLGKPVGALAGGTVDRYGRQMAMNAVDVAAAINQKIKNSPESLQKTLSGLKSFADEGNTQAALIYQLVRQMNPAGGTE